MSTPPTTITPPTTTITEPMDVDGEEAPAGYQPNRKATTTTDGWYFGVVVPKGWFATVAGICEKWTPAEKIIVDQSKQLQKDQEKLWAKKNCCTPKTRYCFGKCGGGGVTARKSGCGCGK
jgi:hypothetical protein